MSLHEIKTKSGQSYRGTVRRIEVNRIPRVEITIQIPEEQVVTCLPIHDECRDGFWGGNMKELLVLICEFFHVPMTTIMDKGRAIDTCFARWVFFQILRVNGASCYEVGREVNKDHTTVVYGVRTFWDLIQQNPFYKMRFEAFLKSIGLNPDFYMVNLSSK